MQPKVTVVIPFYNCPYVDQAISSVLNQTYPHVEVIVVDDGSTLHADRITPYMNRIHYLGKKNGGTASALNHGIRSASGDYIAWLSSDDMYKPDKIMRQAQFMQMNSSLFSFSAYSGIDGENRIIQPFVGPPLSVPQDIYRLISLYNPINGCTMMASKELFRQYGLFDEGLPCTHDYDMWFRLSLNRVRLDYIPEALTLYRFHGQMGTILHRTQLLKEYDWVRKKYEDQMQLLLRTIP